MLTVQWNETTRARGYELVAQIERAIYEPEATINPVTAADLVRAADELLAIVEAKARATRAAALTPSGLVEGSSCPHCSGSSVRT